MLNVLCLALTDLSPDPTMGCFQLLRVLTVSALTTWLASEAALSAPPSVADAVRRRGQTIYAESCAACHGDRGEGVEDVVAAPLVGDLSVRELGQLIGRTMPDGEPEACVGEDADAVAAYIHHAFYSEEARIRNDPPRIRLTHLTGTQLRQSLADLYSHFSGIQPPQSERGLSGVYFTGSRPNRKNQKIDRVDPQLDFDWKHDGPGGGIDAKDFFVRWQGGLKVDETGTYDIIVESTCAFIFWLGRNDREFVNNRVQSGYKTLFERSVVLTAGRVYPVQIDFFQRKRKTEQPPAKVALRWVPPHGTEEVIPRRNLIPGPVRPAFSLQSKLPPDDRSYGFEQGLSIDRQWDASTTASAAEFSQIVVDELWPVYQNRRKDIDEADRGRLKAFLTELVELAFRGPLDETARNFYIDAQMDREKDDAEAIKRCVLVTLKSPRFLYPGLDSDRSPSRKVANRLALTLYDSLPSDQWLLNAASENRLNDENAIRAAARRMVNDYRTSAKARELMFEWLNLSHFGEIVKTDELFPGHSPEIVADSRASLDAFVDEVVWGESSDFRQLFLADWSFTTPRLADYYGDEWKPSGDADGLARTGASAHRAGVLTHPYVMSGLAYQDSTSPIHRGVFLIRSVLGRTLQPPKEAFTPFSPKLHPNLTTRERIELQTSPQNCQSCHTKINGLGFALENFDAVGRFREKEAGKTIEPTGHYVARDGTVVRFTGAFELAEFLSASHDVHRAFVKKAFQHFVKQPVAAFGPDQLDLLTEKFRTDGFHIRNLLVEIAVIAAQPPVSASSQGFIE